MAKRRGIKRRRGGGTWIIFERSITTDHERLGYSSNAIVSLNASLPLEPGNGTSNCCDWSLYEHQCLAKLSPHVEQNWICHWAGIYKQEVGHTVTSSSQISASYHHVGSLLYTKYFTYHCPRRQASLLSELQIYMSLTLGGSMTHSIHEGGIDYLDHPPVSTRDEFVEGSSNGPNQLDGWDILPEDPSNLWYTGLST